MNKLTSNKTPFQWGQAEEQAFTKVKDAMAKAPTLALPDWGKPFNIRCDASGTAVGAVLYQTDKDKVTPIAYHSKTLGKAERNWCATDKELFAIVSAARKWPGICAGSKINFFTDHLPLKYVKSQKDPRGKRIRWLLELERLFVTPSANVLSRNGMRMILIKQRHQKLSL